MTKSSWTCVDGGRRASEWRVEMVGKESDTLVRAMSKHNEALGR